MSYPGKKPLFDAILLKDLSGDSIQNPPSGYIALVDRYGVPYKRDSSGVETPFGVGGSGGINFISNGDFEQTPDGALPAGWSLYAESDAVTFQDSGETVTLTAHGLNNGDTVSFTSITSTTGISANTLYYVISVTANTFQLSLTSGGSAIALTTNGSGTMVRGKPKTGAGGSAGILFAASTTAPLDGLVSAVLTKDPANRMGNGVAKTFTVPLGWRAARLTSLRVLLGNASGAYTAGDLSFYIYDVDNSTLITPYVTAIPKINNGYNVAFLSSTSANYKLIIHVATPTTTAYQAFFDDFVIDPMPAGGVANAQGEYESTNNFTVGGSTSAPTFNAATVYYRNTYRDGRYAIIRWEIRQTSAGSANGSGDYTLPLPAGLAIDYSRISPTGISGPSSHCGSGFLQVNATNFEAMAYAYSSGAAGYLNKIVVNYSGDATPVTGWGSGGGSATNGTVILGITARIPIVGWSDELNVGPGAQPEYLSHDGVSQSHTWALLPALAGAINNTTYTLNPSTPCQPDDMLDVEIRDASGQVLSNGAYPWIQGQSSYMWGIQVRKLPSGQVLAVFGNAGFSPTSGVNSVASGNTWNDFRLLGWTWRIRRARGTNPTGFGKATATESGLVSGGNVPGAAGGTAIAAGNVGEVKTGSMAAATTLSMNTYIDGTSNLSLEGGLWHITFQSSAYINMPNAGEICLVARIFNVTDNANLTIIDFIGLRNNVAGVDADSYNHPFHLTAILNVPHGSTKVVKGQVASGAVSGSPTSGGCGIRNTGSFYAHRMA